MRSLVSCSVLVFAPFFVGCSAEAVAREATSATSLTADDAAMTAGEAAVTVGFNDAPVIDAMTIDSGTVDRLGVRAHDADGDAIVAFAWSASCDGTFDDAHAERPGFTRALHADPCSFTVRITDARGGSATGILHVEQCSFPIRGEPSRGDESGQ